MDHSDLRTRMHELVENYYDLVYRYCFRLAASASDADDLTQQTFLQAQQKLDQVQDRERVGGWLLAIASNLYLQSHRGRRGRGWLSLAEVPEPEVPEIPPGPLDGAELQQLLEQLPEEFRVPLLMFYFESLTYREIAERLTIPVGTVMSRLSRAKAWLRSRLAETQGDRVTVPPAEFDQES